MGVRATILALLLPVLLSAQVIPDHRQVDWSRAGNTTEIHSPSQVIDIMSVGGISDQSASNNSAILSAISQLNGQAGSIYFPDGLYLFDQTIFLPDSTWLVGESSNAKLLFKLNGNGHCIQMAGTETTDTVWFDLAASKGDMQLNVSHASGLSIGEMLRIGMTDDDLITSEWAEGFVGQCVMIDSIDGNSIILQDPLNINLELIRTPYAIRNIPRVHAGLECLSIERLDNATSHFINIEIKRAFNCAIKSVTSDMAVFAHASVSASCHVEISESYFKNAFSYGGGGEGYGAVVQYASSFNLVQGNIFEHLRHSMLLQAGSNANVFGYNYSRDSFWNEGGFPTNSAGDIVLHGNYPFLNLFEGNVAQTIIVDASHGINGPYNTFFRNRAELYGMIMDSDIPTDSLNWIGNEVSATGFPFGNFVLSGAGQFSHGNNVFGEVTPPGTGSVVDTSLYLDLPLSDFEGVWPLIGFPASIGDHEPPAQTRYNSGEFTACTGPVITEVNTVERLLIWQEENGIIHFDERLNGASVKIYSSDGKLIHSGRIDRSVFQEKIGSGVYVIEIDHNEVGVIRTKVVGLSN